MKVKKVLAVALAIALTKTAFAQSAGDGKTMERGHYYVLSRSLAEKLSIDYDFIVKEFQPSSDEFIAVKVDEKNQIDISIFDNSQFSAARADIVQQ